MTKTNTQIPFCGFYESIANACLDYEQQAIIDSYLELDGYNPECHPLNTENYTKLSKLNYNDLVLLSNHLNDNLSFEFETAKRNITQDWVYQFESILEKETGIHLNVDIKTLSITSPRFYNFETDTLFCDVDFQAMLDLLNLEKENFKTWLVNRMRPCSGFIPYYSNHLDDWGVFKSWDYKQYGLLLDYYNELYEIDENIELDDTYDVYCSDDVNKVISDYLKTLESDE